MVLSLTLSEAVRVGVRELLPVVETADSDADMLVDPDKVTDDDMEVDAVGDNDLDDVTPERVVDPVALNVRVKEAEVDVDFVKLGLVVGVDDGTVHTALPALENWPAGQTPLQLDVVRPDALPYCPAEQLLQTTAPPALYRPALRAFEHNTSNKKSNI